MGQTSSDLDLTLGNLLSRECVPTTRQGARVHVAWYEGTLEG